MKKSREETAETRSRIVAAATRQFLQAGLQATGLAEIMAAAGLTHGGFYRHFASKDQLVAEACAAGLDAVVGNTEDAARHGGRSGLEEIVERYVAINHRDNRDGGCPLAGLGSELARADKDTRAAVSSGIEKLVDVLAKRIRRRKPEAARANALFALSAMIGAVTLSRIVTDSALSAAILDDTKERLANL